MNIVVIKGKRMLSMLSMFIIGIFIITACYNCTNEKNQSKETMSLPVSNKVIILDAGHGKPDGGASSSSGVTEQELNLQIVLKLQGLLEQSGATVLLTRSDENGIYDLDSKTIRQKKISDLKNRVKLANESSADMFVSIHLNKISQEQYSGWQVFYKENSEESKKIASSIQTNLNEAIQINKKREVAKLKNIYLVENVEVPMCVAECGFLSNEKEAKNLCKPEYQEQLAWGIYNGIMDYFNEKN